MKFYYFLIYLILFSLTSNAQDLNIQRLNAANSAYQKGKFEQAIDSYEAIIEDGNSSIAIYHNLGNAYYKTGALGKAILNYKRALTLGADADTQKNLEIAQSEQADELIALGATPLDSWNNFVSIVSETVWTSLLIVFTWIAVIGLVIWLLASERTNRKRGFSIGIASLFFAFLLGIMSYTSYRLSIDQYQAVLIAKKADLHLAPDQDSEVINILNEGLDLTIKEQIGDWYLVRLVNGDEGWILEDDLEKI